MTKTELREVLDLHQKWLNLEDDGVRANLHDCDLSGADLQGVDLSRANLLRANLHGADLRGAYLGGCNLYEADLSCADMQGAIFHNANFTGANLRESNLSGSDMFLANLKRANLRESDLREANLVGADLRGADLRSARNVPFIPLICPEKGEFTSFIRCGDYIVELLIPADAKRFSATTRRCWANYAKVLSITTLSGDPVETISVTDTEVSPNIVYTVGEFVYPNYFSDDRWDEYYGGIYFFINRQEAVNH